MRNILHTNVQVWAPLCTVQSEKHVSSPTALNVGQPPMVVKEYMRLPHGLLAVITLTGQVIEYYMLQIGFPALRPMFGRRTVNV